jgi:hypothetical protein
MPFLRTNWANGGAPRGAPRIHAYKSTDTIATINTAGYFNAVSAEVSVGDAIHIFADTGGTPQGYLATINSNTGGVVDITDGLAFGTTDTD